MCILNLSEERGSMDEQSCRDFVEEYFEKKFELLSFIKPDIYTKETNEIIKLKYKKKDKQTSIFNVKATYRWHHETRYKETKEVDTVLDRNPFKRFQNTNCPFQVTFKALKDNVNTFSCNIFIDHCHNHAVISLEALSDKVLLTEIKMETEALFSSGLTP